VIRDVVVTAPARRELRRLDRQHATRITQALRRLAETEQGDVKRLHGSDSEWRLRVGDWCVIFEFDAAAQAILVLHVLPRGRAYRD
jgi:mRNA-degrading endonuclease RelE of RelBE toxin-antitoxin system